MNGTIQQIQNVVVLMFENRSFDHLFGAFPGVNGIFAENGSVKRCIYNLPDPTRPQSPSNQVCLPSAITPDVQLVHDFDHNFGNGMMQELFGPGTTGWAAGRPINAPLTYPSTNSGFFSTKAYNYDPSGKTTNGPQAMSYYEYGSLEVLHTLASNFVLCDNWFCDMPGDTLLNRIFMHTAQTGNLLTDRQPITVQVQTIFDRIAAKPSTWKIYVPCAQIDGEIRNGQVDSSFLGTIENSPCADRPLTEFASDVNAGTLPFYSFLMCWLPPGVPDTSMHPNSDIRPGENYLAAVYNTLRNSPYWNNTLLIVTFDENGGIYDHVVPPNTIAPNAPNSSLLTEWDEYLQATCSFDFTLLGPRIPAILISPWLRSGIARMQYQNTSILHMIEDLLGSAALTQRDANAPSLDSLFAEFGLSQVRTDCPASIAGYPDFPYADGSLSTPYVPPSGMKIAPPAYMAQLARTYFRSRNDRQTGG